MMLAAVTRYSWPSTGCWAYDVIGIVTGVKDVRGSTGASASKASSVIVASEGRVHPAPLALFGESRSE